MVDLQRLFDVSMKGLNLMQGLAQQGKDIKPVWNALTNIWSKQADQVTDEDLDKTEADLDAALDEFEKPMNKLGAK